MFIPLLIAGVEALRNSGQDARIARLGSAVAIGCASLIYLLSTLAGVGSQRAEWIQSFPCEIATAVALAYCAFAFFHHWRRRASSGGLLAMLSCGCYGAVRTLYILAPAGSLGRWFGLDLLCQGGIAIATLLLLLEEESRAKAALLEREQRYRLLFERNLAGVFRAKTNGTLIDCNDALCKLFGYSSREEFRRQDVLSLYGDHQRTAGAAGLRGGQLISHEIRLSRKDASEMMVLVNISVLAEPSSGALEMEGTVLDVSEVRRLQENLVQSQKMEAIGSFAGGVAHDFNNLLMVITAYCELLEDGVINAEQRQHVEEALKACWKAAELTKQLLVFSRKQPISPQCLDLNAVVRDMSGMLRRLVSENIKLQFDLQDQLGLCRVDATHMQQVLMNLAANAQDAMPKGGYLLIHTASTTVTDEEAARMPEMLPGEYVLLSVCDSGTGIDPAIRSHIFEPFFTTKQIGKGTGLGLSTVYGIVKQNKGHIVMESEPGCGTTFRIYLPRVFESATMPEAEIASKPAAREVIPATATILLVEDETALREAGANYLRARGYEVLTAANGEEAIALALEDSTRPHVLVTDVMMPGLTGPELAQVLCELKPGLRVLFMSGFPADSPAHELLGPAAGAYLQKPFSFHTLSERLEALLKDDGTLSQTLP